MRKPSEISPRAGATPAILSGHGRCSTSSDLPNLAQPVESSPVPALVQWLKRELRSRPIPGSLVLIGLPNGAALTALDEIAPGTKVVAIEPDPANARFFQRDSTGQKWHASGRLIYLADPDYTGADNAWRLLPLNGDRPLVLSHPDLRRTEGVGRAKQILKRILFGVEANAAARQRFAPRYLTNSIRNIPAILRGHDVATLRDAYRGVPAVVVAAGPSLNAAIEPLRTARRRALVIAVDTALRPLLVGGVAPQLVVGMDPGIANLRHFLSLPECRDTWLVAESALDPRAAHHFGDRTLWFRVANHQPWPWLRQHGIDVAQLDVWGSVLTGAYQVACLAGCDPIVFAGADLAYPGGQSYARGTTYEFDWAWYGGYGRSLADTWAQVTSSDKAITARDFRGEPIRTTELLQSFRDWTVAQVQRSGRRIISVSSGILYGERIEQMSLSDALTEEFTIPPVHTLVSPPDLAVGADLASHMASIRDALGAGDATVAPLPQWREFSGGGFNEAALAEALAVAIEQSGPGGPPPSPASGWAVHLGRQRERSHHERLAETSRRLHAGLNGLPPGPSPLPDSAATYSVLTQAFASLVAIGNLLLNDATDVTPVTNTPEYGQLPVALDYAWSDEQRWVLQDFEGLLGSAWGPNALTPPSAFQNWPVAGRDIAAHDSTLHPWFSRPNSLRAFRRLVAEWLLCLASADSDAAWTFDTDRLMVIQGLLRSEPETSETTAWLTLRAADGSSSDVPLGFSVVRLARALTGMLSSSLNTAHTLVDGIAIEGRLSLAVKPGLDIIGLPSTATATRTRILTEELAVKTTVAYSTPRGVVCVAPHQHWSTIVGPDGQIVTHHVWPRPIVGELPLGDDGAIAWGTGLASLTDTRPGYVMYRAHAGGDVIVDELPVRPNVGAWIGERLYWSCWPGVAASWTGLASWLPGEGVRLEVSGLPPIGCIRRDGETLFLDPLSLGTNECIERASLTWGWKWRPGGTLLPSRTAPEGTATATASNGIWSATAYFASDAIELSSTDGRRRWLTCYNPFRLAWLGPSLLVSTVEQELYLFENLTDTLEHAR